MRGDALKSLGQLSNALGEVRNRVNHSRRRHTLFRKRKAWNTVCSAMDAVEDTCSALISYSEREPLQRDEKGAAYLLAYGVLHSLYLQQDAVYWLCHCLRIKAVAAFSEPGSWALTIPELERARNARNDSTGHPVRRTQPTLAAFFISQHSLTDEGFQLLEVSAGNASTFRHVSLPTLVQDQVRVLTDVLTHGCKDLDDADTDHYRRFMHQPLTPILDKVDYWVGKLGNKQGSDGPMIVPAVKSIRTSLGQLREEVLKRDEPFDDMYGWEFRLLMRALSLLREYAENAANTDHDLAEVLAYFVRHAIDDLRRITRELDDRYAKS